MNDKSLVKRAKRGDIDAFGTLYEKIYIDLYRFALYTLRNTHDAEDVVSDTVTDAFSTIRKLRSEDAFHSWMFQILINKCRKKMKDYTVKNSEYTEEIVDYKYSNQENEMEESMDVRKCFFDLEDLDRMIISLHVFGGYKTREIAELLNMNENTVRSKESRALNKMKLQLKDNQTSELDSGKERFKLC